MMPRQWKIWIMGVVAFVLAVHGTDWMLATARLDDVVIETSLDPPSVVADGKSSVVLTVRVTERGQPRAGDLVQSWLDTGSGHLVPQWVYTDDNGTAKINLTPNAMTRYEVQDRAEIHVRDVSIGRLIEVGKDTVVVVPLAGPEEQEEQKPGMTFGS
jgi:hypothetical protein